MHFLGLGEGFLEHGVVDEIGNQQATHHPKKDGTDEGTDLGADAGVGHSGSGTLPFTGGDSLPLAAGGLALVLMGGALVLVRRRAGVTR